MPRFPSAQGRLNHDPGFHLSCDENLSEGWGPPLPIVERICSVRRSAGRSRVRSLMGSSSVGSGLKGSEEKTRIVFGGGILRRNSNNY